MGCGSEGWGESVQGFGQSRPWFVRTTSKLLGRSKLWFHVEEIDEKFWILTKPHQFFTMCIWHGLRSLKSIQWCLCHVFLLEQQKNCQDEKFSDANRCVVLQHGQAQKNALNDSANYRAKSRAIVFSSKPLLGWSSLQTGNWNQSGT